jgi:SAM-dependent MidA family methyltransferase
MQQWLYGDNGYYTNFIDIGKGGDFYTAVSSSMFFGGSVANRVIKTIDEGYLTEDTAIVEIGAHKGYMMADIVQFIYTLRPELLDTLRFIIIEPWESNYIKQLEYFNSSFQNRVKLEHFKDLNHLHIDEAFIVANEIFDAFSCEVIKDNKMLYMDEDRAYFDQITPDVKALLDKYSIKRGELPLAYKEFANKLAKAFKKYEFVTFDYGDIQRRDDFSLRIYHKHKSYPFFELTDFVESTTDTTLKQLYQNSDITYDVDFRLLIDEFKDSGAKYIWFKNQMATLVEFGITDLLEMLAKNSNETTYKRELDRAKILINPAFMGERFKAIIFRRES